MLIKAKYELLIVFTFLQTFVLRTKVCKNVKT